jgi:hypothetical protein
VALQPTTDPVTVPLMPDAPTVTPPRTLHQRIAPLVPEGEDSPDLAPTTQTTLSSAQKRGALAHEMATAPEQLVVVRQTLLGSVADNNTASNVGEPSVATNGRLVFYTGNWYAALSTDGGENFRYVDPATAFPDPPGMHFCCDQVVHYVRKIDTFVWLLQYSEDEQGENIQRLAFASTQEVRQGRWRIFDLRASDLGLSTAFLDFPDLAVGANMLYLTTNAFEHEKWVASTLIRFPLAGLATGKPTAQHTISRENFNFRVAQHCGQRVYWASHHTTSSLRVFSWAEGAAQPSYTDVTLPKWNGASGYTSITPDGRNWLGRADSRLLGAAKVGRELWFAWNANQGGANQRPHPYVQIARLRAADLTSLESINIWEPDFAIAYAALTSNGQREAGVSYMIGGGEHFPSHVVGILTPPRRELIVATGTRGPQDNYWGDFLSIRRHYPQTRLFAATGYTLQRDEGANDATPHFLLFGRQRALG